MLAVLQSLPEDTQVYLLAAVPSAVVQRRHGHGSGERAAEACRRLSALGVTTALIPSSQTALLQSRPVLARLARRKKLADVLVAVQSLSHKLLKVRGVTFVRNMGRPSHSRRGRFPGAAANCSMCALSPRDASSLLWTGHTSSPTPTMLLVNTHRRDCKPEHILHRWPRQMDLLLTSQVVESWRSAREALLRDLPSPGEP